MRLANLIKRVFIFFNKNLKNYKLNDIKDECIIIGSGPSINQLNIDSKFFVDKDLIGCNFIHKNSKFYSRSFKFYSIIDIDYSKSIKKDYFYGLNCKNIIISTKNALYFNSKILMRKNIKIVKTKIFNADENYNGKDISMKKFFLTGNSIPFLIQVAAFVGKYKKIYLLGVDHFDINDFGNLKNMNFADYKGRRVKELKMNNKKLDYINALYLLVKKLALNNNTKIINITPNSKLKIFKKLKINDLEKR